MNKIIEYGVLTLIGIILIGSLIGTLMDRPVFISYAYSSSMTPTINKGDVFFINPLSRDPEIGDIVVFNVGETWTVHRIVGIVEDGYLTKGDNNIATDQQSRNVPPIKRSQIGGKVITINGKPITIPKLGLYLNRASLSDRGKMLIAGFLVIFGALAFTGGEEKRKKRKRFIRIRFKTVYLLSSVLLLVMISAATFVSWQMFPIEYAVTSAGGAQEGWYLPGQSFEQEISVQNKNFYPMYYYISAASPDIDYITETQFKLGKGQEKNIVVSITAPKETTIYVSKVRINAYMPILPRSLITYLYDINPVVPLLAMLVEVSALLGVLYVLSGIGDEDIVKIRTKRSAFWRQFKEGVFRI